MQHAYQPTCEKTSYLTSAFSKCQKSFNWNTPGVQLEYGGIPAGMQGRSAGLHRLELRRQLFCRVRAFSPFVPFNPSPSGKLSNTFQHMTVLNKKNTGKLTNTTNTRRHDEEIYCMRTNHQ